MRFQNTNKTHIITTVASESLFELNLFGFVRLGLGNKKISTILHLSPDRVNGSRSRLRKKIKANYQTKVLETFLAYF